MQSLITWVTANYAQCLQAVLALVVALEMIVRVAIPTSSSAGFLERLGGWIQDLMDLLKVPVAMKTSSGAALVSPTTAAQIDAQNAQAPILPPSK